MGCRTAEQGPITLQVTWPSGQAVSHKKIAVSNRATMPSRTMASLFMRSSSAATFPDRGCAGKFACLPAICTAKIRGSGTNVESVGSSPCRGLKKRVTRYGHCAVDSGVFGALSCTSPCTTPLCQPELAPRYARTSLEVLRRRARQLRTQGAGSLSEIVTDMDSVEEVAFGRCGRESRCVTTLWGNSGCEAHFLYRTFGLGRLCGTDVRGHCPDIVPGTAPDRDAARGSRDRMLLVCSRRELLWNCVWTEFQALELQEFFSLVLVTPCS